MAKKAKKDANCLMESDKPQKKVFDKKKWRDQKYSVKHRVNKWNETRKKRLENEYKKDLLKDGIQPSGTFNCSGQKKKNLSRLREAQLECDRKLEEKRAKKQEMENIRKEKNLRLQQYREKKAERFRKLSQKTRKGQPLMRGRLELLQEKIERLVAENKL